MNTPTPRQREIIQLYTESIRQASTVERLKASKNTLRGFVYGLVTCSYMSMTEAKNIIDRWCK